MFTRANEAAANFGQVVVRRLFRDHGFLTQICGNNFMTLKVAPPLLARRVINV